MIQDLKKDYGQRKKAIKKRLKAFRAVWQDDDKKIFSELCFCICTPQSKAVQCDKAISALVKSGGLYDGDIRKVRTGLAGVRFPNNKAGYIVETRERFSSGGKIRVKDRIDPGDIKGTRDRLVNDVKGIGFKEASHFLRNIGFGEELAILDVHILRNMVRYGVIKEIPKSVSRKVYLELEGKLKKFSDEINVPMGELDILFWSRETGEIFK